MKIAKKVLIADLSSIISDKMINCIGHKLMYSKNTLMPPRPNDYLKR